MQWRTPFRPFTVLAATLVVASLAAPAAAQQKPTLTPADYARWESLGNETLSPDGKWLAYTISRVDDDGDLRIRLLGSDSTVIVDYARGLIFSSDNRWAAFSISHAEDELDGARDRGETLHSKVGLFDLESGEMTDVPDVASFRFSADGRYIAMRGYVPEGRDGNAADLIVRDLETRRNTTLGNITQYDWRDDGHLLAMIVDTEDNLGNGVQLFDPERGTLRTIESDTSSFQRLSWREDASDLMVMRIVRDEDRDGESHALVVWKDVGADDAERFEFDQSMINDPIRAMRIVDFRSVSWSDDGESLFFGVQEWKRTDAAERAAADSVDAENAEGQDEAGGDADDEDAEDEDEDESNVEVWHARDVEIIPQQKVRASQERNRNYLSAWHIKDDRYVALGNELTEDVGVVDGTDIALGTDETPHEVEGMFGPNYEDVYVIDIETGDRRLIKSRAQYNYDTSPSGRYFVYLEDDHYRVMDIESGEETNITQGIATPFIDVEDDHTVEQKPPFGFVGWLEDEREVVLYSKYDIWRVAIDGSGGTNLTNGEAEKVRHRLYTIANDDDDDDDYVDISDRYVSLRGDVTKQSGYGLLRGRNGDGGVDRLVFLDKGVGGLEKAEDADVYMYEVEAFDDSPDLFVAGADLAEGTQVTATNAFQSEYAWGRGELIDFENTNGVPLQGALFYPANYEPGRQYPMIVYIYEITSTSLHNYGNPSKRSAYNPTVWTQNGYFVYRPDIVYRDRNPGLSAVEALVPAVEKVLETGMIDPERVGLVGHSWGGYQTAFVPTQTDIFAAAVAGAPLTEMSSMYLSIYWNTGGTDARIFEISQGRMEVPPWQDLETYVANSPVFQVESLNTPMMIAFGTEDGAVDWDQGIVYYNAARRAGKDFVMLVYEGENHSLAREGNQLDYQRRINEWFGHYLKGEPAKDWIVNGVRFLDRGREGVRSSTDDGS